MNGVFSTVRGNLEDLAMAKMVNFYDESEEKNEESYQPNSKY
jgi:hypothetical protein